jgi:hypothetical protein
MSEITQEKTADTKGDDKDSSQNSVFLVSYPKLVFLYPTILAALFGAIYMAAKGNDPTAAYAALPARIFLLVFAVNLVVISFDFPRTTSLTWFFAGVAICVGLFTIIRLNDNVLPALSRVLESVQPKANVAFYVVYISIMLLLFLAVIISRKFDYWEVRGNELLHHHGILSDMKRYSAPSLRIDKEINDIFEYLLLRSGRLILHPSQERRAIVLENVFFINQKEELITRQLGSLQVRLRTENN